LSAETHAANNYVADEYWPKGYWLTDDRAAAVEFVTCGENGINLCGIIRALPGIKTDPRLAAHASELCGLPLLWDFSFDKKRMRWTGGSILDPETEEVFPAIIWMDGPTLKVHAYEGVEAFGVTFDWTPTPVSNLGCEVGQPSSNGASAVN